MHKVIDVKLTSIASPVCQALIHEHVSDRSEQSAQKLLTNNSDLLVIRLDNTVIGYALFDLISGEQLQLASVHFRSIIKDHMLGEYWLTRLLKRRLKNHTYNEFLLDS